MFSTMEIYNNSIHYTLDTQLIYDIIGNSHTQFKNPV
jgi:hypothetical protein